MFSTRTDLAMESFEGMGKDAMPGVQVSHWEAADIRITEVVITDEQSANQLGKPCGTYLTMESALLRERDPDARLAVAALLAEEMARIIPAEPADAPVMVVGLGNRNITPDSLGPQTVDRTLVTRHMMQGEFAQSGMHSVCAIAPGVLGITGVETFEMVECLVGMLKPRAIVCIDSLAARDSGRIGSTIQLTNTGIQPGGGVGNHRKPLTQDSIGVPVISVGMPTVIYAATLARDAFAWLNQQDDDSASHNTAFEEMERSLLKAEIGEMIVTPREVDAMIQDAAGIIASGINRALQPQLSDAEISAMMN